MLGFAVLDKEETLLLAVAVALVSFELPSRFLLTFLLYLSLEVRQFLLLFLDFQQFIVDLLMLDIKRRIQDLLACHQASFLLVLSMIFLLY